MINIFDYIEDQKIKYEKEIELEDGWSWNMKRHLRISSLYLNSQFDENNENRDLRPNKNIILPILNVQFRTEGFDVKDIEIYVNNPDIFYKSLLIKKYHDKWALDKQIDRFIDRMVISYCVYGGVLVRNTGEAKPEVINLKSIAFCNQRNILDNPFGISHKLSFAQLREKEKVGWGQDDISIEDLIELTKKEEKDEVEVIEVHGQLPKEWLDDEEIASMEDTEEDINQMQIVSFYTKEDNSKQGVVLFRKRMPKLPFKFLSRDEIEDRALGRGGVEELLEGQIWTNFSEQKVTEMLDGASKNLHWTDDPTFKAKNKLDDVENNEILKLGDGRKIQKIDTFPTNIVVFNDSINRWQEHTQILGAATDPLLGETPTAGTPFKLYEAQQIESKSMHRYRQGQIAAFMDEIYRDWVLPHLAKEVSKEQEFMSILSFEEMQNVVEAVVGKKVNQFKKNIILALRGVNSEDLVSAYENQIRNDLAKKGNKFFFKILQNEMKDIDLKAMTNIAGKQKNLALLTDKLVGVFRQYIELKSKGIDTTEVDSLLNTILESSGISPLMFNFSSAQIAQPQAQPQAMANQLMANQPVKR